jgi:signal peptidase II
VNPTGGRVNPTRRREFPPPGPFRSSRSASTSSTRRPSTGPCTIDIVGSLRLNLAFNTGAAFSGGAGYGPLIAVVVTVVVVVLILRRRQVIESAVGTVAVGMIAGGAIGNLSDRLFRAGEGLLGGAVVDFVDLQWWPIFNVADAAVILGGLMLVVDSVRVQRAAPTDPAEP